MGFSFPHPLETLWSQAREKARQRVFHFRVKFPTVPGGRTETHPSASASVKLASQPDQGSDAKSSQA
jgi:hypothetical protein